MQTVSREAEYGLFHSAPVALTTYLSATDSIKNWPYLETRQRTHKHVPVVFKFTPKKIKCSSAICYFYHAKTLKVI